jgi:hypothetical protein
MVNAIETTTIRGSSYGLDPKEKATGSEEVHRWILNDKTPYSGWAVRKNLRQGDTVLGYQFLRFGKKYRAWYSAWDFPRPVAWLVVYNDANLRERLQISTREVEWFASDVKWYDVHGRHPADRHFTIVGYALKTHDDGWEHHLNAWSDLSWCDLCGHSGLASDVHAMRAFNYRGRLWQTVRALFPKSLVPRSSQPMDALYDDLIGALCATCRRQVRHIARALVDLELTIGVVKQGVSDGSNIATSEVSAPGGACEGYRRTNEAPARNVSRFTCETTDGL